MVGFVEYINLTKFVEYINLTKEEREKCYMKIYEMGRRSGKTFKCIIELVKNHNAIMIVPTHSVKKHVIDNYQTIKNIDNRVFTIREILDRRACVHSNNYFIVDELDWVLKNILNQEIKFATLTPSDE